MQLLNKALRFAFRQSRTFLFFFLNQIYCPSRVEDPMSDITLFAGGLLPLIYYRYVCILADV